MDGMKLGVLPDRLAYADTVIYLDVSTWACLSGSCGDGSGSADGLFPNSVSMTASAGNSSDGSGHFAGASVQ
jgi:hypothetical protein